jgi:hypothetical protein
VMAARKRGAAEEAEESLAKRGRYNAYGENESKLERERHSALFLNGDRWFAVLTSAYAFLVLLSDDPRRGNFLLAFGAASAVTLLGEWCGRSFPSRTSFVTCCGMALSPRWLGSP